MNESGSTASAAGAAAASAARQLAVLHVIAPARYGGLERVVNDLACGQARRGHKVMVAATIEGEPDDYVCLRSLRSASVEVHVLRTGSRAYVQEWRSVRRLIRAWTPIIVHTHGYRSDIIGGRAARAERVPVVSTTHGFSHGHWKNRLYEWLQRRELRQFDGVVSVSGAMAEEIIGAGVSRSRVWVIPNAVPPAEKPLPADHARRVLGLKLDAFHIGWVGRFSWAKGLDVFVESLRHLPKEAAWRASIIGDGAEGNVARELSLRCGVADRIDWHGAVPDAARLMSAFDVMVLSSRTEGTPMALLEAMVARVPLVCTRVGGIPDVVGPAEAILVNSADPPALAAGIMRIRDNPTEASARTEAAAARLTAFAAGPWLDQYDRAYQAARSRWHA